MEPQRQNETVLLQTKGIIYPSFANCVYCGDQNRGGVHYAASTSHGMFTRVGQSPQGNII
jgi:hypothetical protein